MLRKRGHLSEKFKRSKYLHMRDIQNISVNMTVFYIGLFFAVLFNYVYTMYLARLTEFICEGTVKIFDKIGFEVHFVRLIYYTIFDQSTQDPLNQSATVFYQSLLIDHFHLLVIIIPMFILSIKYLTASSIEPYQ